MPGARLLHTDQSLRCGTSGHDTSGTYGPTAPAEVSRRGHPPDSGGDLGHRPPRAPAAAACHAPTNPARYLRTIPLCEVTAPPRKNRHPPGFGPPSGTSAQHLGGRAGHDRGHLGRHVRGDLGGHGTRHVSGHGTGHVRGHLSDQSTRSRSAHLTARLSCPHGQARLSAPQRAPHGRNNTPQHPNGHHTGARHASGHHTPARHA